jgi:hypothetical protein
VEKLRSWQACSRDDDNIADEKGHMLDIVSFFFLERTRSKGMRTPLDLERELPTKATRRLRRVGHSCHPTTV